MKTILHVNSSIFGDGGQSSRLATEFISQLPDARVVTRDLAAGPLPHLDAERFGAFLEQHDFRTIGVEHAGESLRPVEDALARLAAVHDGDGRSLRQVGCPQLRLEL